MERVGIEALSVGLPFDEAAVLLENKIYLLNTLDVSRLEVYYVSRIGDCRFNFNIALVQRIIFIFYMFSQLFR